MLLVGPREGGGSVERQLRRNAVVWRRSAVTRSTPVVQRPSGGYVRVEVGLRGGRVLRALLLLGGEWIR